MGTGYYGPGPEDEVDDEEVYQPEPLPPSPPSVPYEGQETDADAHTVPSWEVA